MPVISSFGTLETYSAPQSGGVPVIDTALSRRTLLDDPCFDTYAFIYRTQPNVRTVVDFLSETVGQLPLHAYRRHSDIDRERLANYPLIDWVAKPNPGTTASRLIGSMVKDFCIFHAAYWVKVRMEDRVGLVRMPPQNVTVSGWLIPRSFVWTLPDGRELELPRNDVVYFQGYDPLDPLMGISPLETLRQILAEDAAQTTYRRQYWQNSARLEGVVERPKDAPKWQLDQKQAFREQWQARYNGLSPGQVAVLEDGMTFKPTSYSARDSEFVSARKLTAEEVTRIFQVPLPMVGILDHATYSNVREQRKQLYQDTIAPWLTFLQQELTRQLLPECADTKNVYLEFNFADKLRGAFEEMSDSLYKLVGRPIMTANEGRARLNLPAIKNDASANELALPLNTSSGADEDPADEPPADRALPPGAPADDAAAEQEQETPHAA